MKDFTVELLTKTIGEYDKEYLLRGINWRSIEVVHEEPESREKRLETRNTFKEKIGVDTTGVYVYANTPIWTYCT
jgi:hypothetical protein